MKLKTDLFSYLKPIADLSEKPIIYGVRQGYMNMAPFLMCGALVLAILNVPVAGFHEFMAYHIGESWRTFPTIVYTATMQVLSLIALVSISHSITSLERLVQSGAIPHILPVLTAFACYVALMRPDSLAQVAISTETAGASSMFVAMAVAIISVKSLVFFYTIYDRIAPEKRHSFNGNVAFRATFRISVPVFITIAIFAAAHMLFHDANLNERISELFVGGFHGLFLRGDLLSVILIVFVTQILWFFGIHGGNVFMEAYSYAHERALDLGMPVSPFSKEFFDVFVYLGGAGSTLALVAVLLLFGERHSQRRLARGAIIPSLLNINEPLLYGLPIVLNPVYCVPFLLAPILSATVSFATLSLGFVPFPNASDITWTTPVFFSGYLSTGSATAVFLQVVCFFVSFVVYMPFVSVARIAAEREYLADFKAMADEMVYVQPTQYRHVINRTDKVGNVARYLAGEISTAIRGGQGDLHIEYQPKIRWDGDVSGAEALLRWNHPVFGYVSPHVILGLADEANISAALGRWIIRESLRDMRSVMDAGIKGVTVSINLSPGQLNTDEQLGTFIENTMKEHGIPPESAEYELTENATIQQTDFLRKTLRRVRELGCAVSIDDFGMGHSSLKYLFDFYANVVKLDISLVQGVTESAERRAIVRAIIDLCKRLKVEVVAEGVETEEQLHIVRELGAHFFQGWYFSKAIPFHEFLDYVKNHKGGAFS
ncbi:MAG: EAL domain-containing protein [Clostridiales Family XIII bacterium]|jgi:lactose/cellobiose-specific phosphotransferase system IIC component|nr:EAL domain-containing protein [Clostridiales Family XIII bacterium]